MTASPRAPRRATGEKARSDPSKYKRTPTDIGLALITPLVGQEFLDRYNLRDPLNRGLKYGVKQVFSVAGATNRQFKKVSGASGGPTRLKTSGSQKGSDYFDLTPDDDQKMIVETLNEFAEEVAASRRPRGRRKRKLSGRSRHQGQLNSASPRSTSRRISTAQPNTVPP